MLTLCRIYATTLPHAAQAAAATSCFNATRSQCIAQAAVQRHPPAGALRDYGRAVIIGERTFGKGLVQYYFPMADGSGLKLTVAKYLTPKSYDISKDGGLNPDIRCKDYPHGELRG